jgi:hypothetical protein
MWHNRFFSHHPLSVFLKWGAHDRNRENVKTVLTKEYNPCNRCKCEILRQSDFSTNLLPKENKWYSKRLHKFCDSLMCTHSMKRKINFVYEDWIVMYCLDNFRLQRINTIFFCIYVEVSEVYMTCEMLVSLQLCVAGFCFSLILPDSETNDDCVFPTRNCAGSRSTSIRQQVTGMCICLEISWCYISVYCKFFWRAWWVYANVSVPDYELQPSWRPKNICDEHSQKMRRTGKR